MLTSVLQTLISPKASPQYVEVHELPDPKSNKGMNAVQLEVQAFDPSNPSDSAKADAHLIGLRDRGVMIQRNLVASLFTQGPDKQKLTGAQCKKLLGRFVKQRSDSPVRRTPTLVYPYESKAGAKQPADALQKKETVEKIFSWANRDEYRSIPLAVTPEQGDQRKDQKAQTPMIQAPAALNYAFYLHLLRLQEGVQATGHIHARHDTNAFPRTWSLEKIGRAVSDVLRQNDGKSLKVNAKEGLTLEASFEDLPIHLSYKEATEGVDSGTTRVMTAFVLNQVSSGLQENHEVDAANALLKSLKNEQLSAMAKNHLKDQHIWSTLALAQVAHEKAAAGGLSDEDSTTIKKLQSLLCLNETRSSGHSELIAKERSKMEGRSSSKIDSK